MQRYKITLALLVVLILNGCYEKYPIPSSEEIDGYTSVQLLPKLPVRGFDFGVDFLNRPQGDIVAEIRHALLNHEFS
jgi:hypothetical protein